MKNNTVVQWLLTNKTGLILGFIFGAFVAPFLSTLGLVIAFFESLKPLLIGPMRFVGSLIPDVQIGPDAFQVPIYKWILALGFNGICYAILSVIIFSVVRGIGSKRQNE